MKPRDLLTPIAAILGLSVTSIALIVSISSQNPNIVRNFAAIMIGVVIIFVATAAATSLARTGTSWPMHMLAIGISAYGFCRYRNNNRIKVGSALLLAIAVHVIFNVSIKILGF
jgi:hypothetical protein